MVSAPASGLRRDSSVQVSRVRSNGGLAHGEVPLHQLLDPVPGDLALGGLSSTTAVTISRALDLYGCLHKRCQRCPETAADYVVEGDTSGSTATTRRDHCE